jgi:hypothetical protein
MQPSNILLNDVFVSEKKRWIGIHGSEYLRAAFDNGYECDSTYVLERIALEYPCFTIAMMNEKYSESLSRYNRVDFPSAIATRESLKHPGSYIATSSIIDDDGSEALVIDNYLGVCQISKLVLRSRAGEPKCFQIFKEGVLIPIPALFFLCLLPFAAPCFYISRLSIPKSLFNITVLAPPTLPFILPIEDKVKDLEDMFKRLFIEHL